MGRSLVGLFPRCLAMVAAVASTVVEVRGVMWWSMKRLQRSQVVNLARQMLPSALTFHLWVVVVQATQDPARPNFLFMLGDDWGQ